jgi:hypothetical protein
VKASPGLWSPAKNENCQLEFNSLDGLRKLYPAFEVDGCSYADYGGPLFKGAQIDDFHLLKDFPGSKYGAKIPDEIRTLIGSSKAETGYVGAFSPAK